MEVEESETDAPPLEAEGINTRWKRVKSVYRPNAELDTSVIRHCGFKDLPMESQVFQINQTVLSPSPSQICDILSSPDYPLGYVGKRRYFRNAFLASRNRLASLITTMFSESELKRLEDKFWKSKRGIPWSLELEEELQTYLKVKSQEKRKRKAFLFGERQHKSFIVNGDMRVSVSKTGVRLKERVAWKHLKKDEEQLSKSERDKILKSRRKVRLQNEIGPDGLPTPDSDSRYAHMHESQRRAMNTSFDRELASPGRATTSSTLSTTEETESWGDQRTSTTPDRSSTHSMRSSVLPSDSKASLRGALDSKASLGGSRDSKGSPRVARDSKGSPRGSRDSKESPRESRDSKASLRSTTFSDVSTKAREPRLKTDLVGVTFSESKPSVKESQRERQQTKESKSATTEIGRRSTVGGLETGSFVSELSHFKLDKKLSKTATINKDEDFKIKFPKTGFREKSLKFKDSDVALPKFSPKLSTKITDLISSRSVTPESRDSVAEVLEIVGEIDAPAEVLKIAGQDDATAYREVDASTSKWKLFGKKAYEVFKTQSDAYAGKPPRMFSIANKLQYLWKKSQTQEALSAEAEAPRRYTGRWDDFHEQQHSAIQDFIRKEQIRQSYEEDIRVSQTRSFTEEAGTLLGTSRLSPEEDSIEIGRPMTILPRKKHVSKESVHKSMTKTSKRTVSYDVVEKRKRLTKSSVNTKGTMLKIMDNVQLFERRLPYKEMEERRKLSYKVREEIRKLSDEERDDKSGSEDANLLDITAFRKEDTPLDDSGEDMDDEDKRDQISRAVEDFLVPHAQRKSLRPTRDALYLSSEELLHATSDRKRHKHKRGSEKVPDLDSPVDEKLDKKRHKDTYSGDEIILPDFPTEDKSVRRKKEKASAKDWTLDTHLKKTRVEKHGAYDLLLRDSPTETKMTKRLKAKHSIDRQLTDSTVGGKSTKKIRDKSGAEKVYTRDTPDEEKLMRKKKEKATSEMVPVPKHLARSKKDKYSEQKEALLASTVDDTQSKPRQDEYVTLTMKLQGKQLTKEKIDQYSDDESQLEDSPLDDAEQQSQDDVYGTETMALRDSHFGKEFMKRQTDKYSVDEFRLLDSPIDATRRKLQKDKYATETTLILDSHAGKTILKEQVYTYSADGSRILDSSTDEQLHTRIEDTFTAERMDGADVDGHIVRQRKTKQAVEDERVADISAEGKKSKRKKDKLGMYEDKVTDLSTESMSSRLRKDTFVASDEGLLDASPSPILEMKEEQKLHSKHERIEKKKIKARDQNIVEDLMSTKLDTEEQDRIHKSRRESRDENILQEFVSAKLDTQAQERKDKSRRQSRDETFLEEAVSAKLDTQEQKRKDKSRRQSRDEKMLEEAVSAKLDTQEEEQKDKSRRESRDEKMLEEAVSAKLDTQEEQERKDKCRRQSRDEKMLEEAVSAKLDTQEQERKDKSRRQSRDEIMLEEAVSSKLDTQEEERKDKSRRQSRDEKILDESVSSKLDTQEQERFGKSRRQSRDEKILQEAVSAKLYKHELERIDKSRRQSRDHIISEDLITPKLDTQEKQERVEKSRKKSKVQNIIVDMLTSKLDFQEQELVEKSQRKSRDENILEDMMTTKIDQRDSEEEEFLTPSFQETFKKSIAETKSPSRKRSEEDERDADEEDDDDMERESKLELVRSQFEFMVSQDKSKPKVRDTRKTRKKAIMEILEKELRKEIHEVEYVDDFEEDVDDDALQYESPTPELIELEIERETELDLEDSPPPRAQDDQTPVEDLGETVLSPTHRKKVKLGKSRRSEVFPERISKKLEPERAHKKGVRPRKAGGDRSPRIDKEGMSSEAIGSQGEKGNEVDTTDTEGWEENEQKANLTTDLHDDNQDMKTGYQKDELPLAYKGSRSKRHLRSESLDSMSSSLMKLTLGSKSRSSSQFKFRLDAATKYKIDTKFFGTDNSLNSWADSLDLSSNGSSERYSDLTNPSSASDVPPRARRFLPRISRTKKARPKATAKRKPTKELILPDIQSDFQARRRQIKIDHPFAGWDQDSQNVLPLTARLPKLMESMPMLINFTAQEENKYKLTFPDYDTLKFPLGSPRTECQHYITQFGIIELFEFMLYNLVITKPDQPLDYLVDLARVIMSQMKKHRAMSQIFTSDMDASGSASVQSAELLAHRTSPVQSAHPLY